MIKQFIILRFVYKNYTGKAQDVFKEEEGQKEGEENDNGIYTSALQLSTFSYYLFSSFLFLNIPVFSMSLLHCSRYFLTALFFSLSLVCL
jgi:hypothetical protein